MRNQHLNRTTLLLLALLLALGMAQGENLSGVISSTKTITDNSKLTGDVTCGAIAPCIKFGAPNLQLKLNGHTITGVNGALDQCTGSTGGAAIGTNGMDGAIIQGPGIITMFQGFAGIVVKGNNSTVSQVVVTGTCGNGISVDGSNNAIRSNSISRFSLTGALAIGAANNGIVVQGDTGGGGNTIDGNEITGAGSLVFVSSNSGLAVYSTGPGYGILVAPGSSGNTIHGNGTSGNAIGIFVWGIGNTISDNQTLGNAALGGGDIYDPNSAGANVYHNNLCQLATGTGAPACPGNIPTKLIGH